MAAFSEIADETFVRDLMVRGVPHLEISRYYQSQYPGVRGVSLRSVRRYCCEREIHRISNDELDEIVREHNTYPPLHYITLHIFNRSSTDGF